jgi:glycosidase
MQRREGHAVLLGEVNLPAEEQRKFFGDENGDELNMLFDFLGMQATYLALARKDATPIIESLQSRPELFRESSFASFLRNHDELTLDKLTDEERQEVFDAFGPDPDMQLYGRGLRRRLPPMLGGDPQWIRMAYSLMFSMPGAPTLFYGEEIGMGENLAVEGRLAVRTPMQWEDGPTAGFTTAPAGSLTRPVPEDDAYGPKAVNVRDQRTDPESLLNWFERLIRLRKELPEVGWGTFEVLDGGDPSTLALRYEWEDRRLITLHNLASHKSKATLDVGDSEWLVDLFGAAEPIAVRNGRARIELSAHDYRWLRPAR